jgi:hypothetical protein
MDLPSATISRPRRVTGYAANWGGQHLEIGDVSGVKAKDLPGAANLAPGIRRIWRTPMKTARAL